MAVRKKKGARHKGVVLLRPDPVRRIGWRARYLDPDLGKQVKVSLDPALTTTELRADWAVRKARALASRRLEIERGDPRLVRKPIDEAIDGYFDAAGNELRDSTLELYRSALATFREWASRANVSFTSELTAHKLPELRDYLLAQRKQALFRGGKRGSRKQSEEKLSPHTINWKLRAVKTVLSEFRKRGLVPLSSDAIKDALKPVPTPREAPQFLGQRDCARLLKAVIRHDSDRFAMTREEHGGGSTVGMTFRYVAIGPLVVSALFTGMRFNELLKLKWSDVDLDAKGSDGAVVGEIRLRATATKTKHARTIGLEVSPALRRLLILLKLRSRGAPYVFGGDKPMSETLANAARLRLSSRFGAPKFSWQMLRRTCGTFLTNAPGIFGAASAYRSAKQLGHSVEVAERHYAGLLRGISIRATSIEAAMEIEEEIATMLDSIRGQTSGVPLLVAS